MISHPWPIPVHVGSGIRKHNNNTSLFSLLLIQRLPSQRYKQKFKMSAVVRNYQSLAHDSRGRKMYTHWCWSLGKGPPAMTHHTGKLENGPTMDRKGYFSVRQDNDKHPSSTCTICSMTRYLPGSTSQPFCHLADVILWVELPALELAQIVSNT